MFKFIVRLFTRIFGLGLTEEQKRLCTTLTEKQLELDKYGGTFEITRYGGVRHIFKTKEGEAAYYNSISTRFWDEAMEKTGCSSPDEIINRWNNK